MIKYDHILNKVLLEQALVDKAEEAVILTRMIMGILDSWGLNAKQQHCVLGLPSKVPTRALRRYREDTPFPDEPAVNERLEHIVGIYEALRTTYPHNPAMGALWMTLENDRFENQKPANILAQDGLDGVLRIRSFLDCSYDWHVDA